MTRSSRLGDGGELAESDERGITFLFFTCSIRLMKCRYVGVAHSQE